MSKILFYREEDYSAIQDNLDIIVENSVKQQHLILDPTEEEYKYIKSVIIDYIIKNKRIVYGGSAYHAIIEEYKKKNKIDNVGRIYKDYEYYDIEFYSPNPIDDLLKICDILHSKNIKYVMGRQAQHEETYTVFANFYQYCDISFMEKIIYDNIPITIIDKISYTAPIFMLVDILRLFNDPLTSYFRLEKTFKRAKLLLKYSDLSIKAKAIVLVEQDKQYKNMINYFMKEIIKLKNIVFIGDLCYLIYMMEEFNSNKLEKLEFYSRNLKKDILVIIDIISKYCSSMKVSKEYFKINKFYKFFQFWDSKIIVYYKNKPLLILFGNNHRCIPIKTKLIKFNEKDNIEINIGSFIVNINYFLISYHYYNIHQDIDDSYISLSNKYFNMIGNLLEKRNEYLKKNAKTVIDPTIYEEFIISCLGKTMEFTRDYLMKMYSKKKSKKGRLLFTYDPDDNSIDYNEIKSYKHSNSTGLIKKKIEY